jgi:predicted N-acyltransferase
LPVPTYSAHWIPDPGFRRAIAQFLARERQMIEHKMDGLSEYSPFRHEEPPCCPSEQKGRLPRN